MPHILVVEDDHGISQLIGRYLRDNDCRVSFSRDGRDLEYVIGESRIDLVVLDVMLPGEDGLSLCRRLRSKSQIPIMMLTAKSDEIDRIVGLELGADDYMSKPFNPRELLARIRSILRRTGANAAPTAVRRPLSFRGWRINASRRELRNPQGTHVTLTGAEFDLLLALCERPGRVLSRDQLLDLTQGRTAAPFERSVDILISRLRRKIEDDPHRPDIIKTVRSGGYVFAADVAAA
jgi:two-component system OmpR family response regulator